MLNLMAAVFLLAGRHAIAGSRRTDHKRYMMTAFFVSTLFLISYLIYHFSIDGPKLYPHKGFAGGLYLAILLTHIPLAVLVIPGSIAAIWCALKGRFETHVKIVRILWPVWIYVSTTGVVIYLMLYVF